MQHQANSVITLFNFGFSPSSVSISTGGLSCGSRLTDFCLPRVSRLTGCAGARLVSFWGTPRRFSSLWRASEAKLSGKVLCIGPRILFRQLQTIGFVVLSKAGRPAPAGALATFNTTARHPAGQPVVQQAALAERHAQCTHNPSLKRTRQRLAAPGRSVILPSAASLRRSAYLKRYASPAESDSSWQASFTAADSRR